MTQPNTAPLLDLSTLEESRPVLIDGQRYDMRPASQFGMREANRLSSFGRTLQDWGERELTDDEIDEAERQLGIALQLILPDLPQEVMERLTYRARMAIVVKFFELESPQGEALAAPANGNRAMRRSRQTPAR